MSYRLSLLDKSPVASGTTPGEALETSLAYAALADRLGYHRFWAAEHHGSAFVASAAPEVLASHLLARTRHIRIGTRGCHREGGRQCRHAAWWSRDGGEG